MQEHPPVSIGRKLPGGKWEELEHGKPTGRALDNAEADIIDNIAKEHKKL